MDEPYYGIEADNNKTVSTIEGAGTDPGSKKDTYGNKI